MISKEAQCRRLLLVVLIVDKQVRKGSHLGLVVAACCCLAQSATSVTVSVKLLCGTELCLKTAHQVIDFG